MRILLVATVFVLFIVPARAEVPALSDILGLNKPIDRLGVEGRATIEQFLNALERAARESKEWRELLDRMRSDFAALPREAGIESKAIIDFMIDRAKENLTEMAAISAAIEGKDYLKALKLFTAMQNATAAKHPPVIGNFSPKHVAMKWLNHDRHQVDGKDQIVLFTGWNFNTDGKALKAECRDVEGKLVRDVSDKLKVSTRYIAQVDISGGSGVALQPTITEIVLVQSGKVLARVPVVWAKRPSPPIKIVALNITYRTMDEDKDNDDSHVHACIFWKGKTVGKGATQKPEDPHRVWPDGSINGPFRLNLSEPVPYDNVGEMKMEVQHWRNTGGPAWRLRIHRVEAVLSDSSTRIVLTEDDQGQKDLYTHRPSRQIWHSFDLRGRKGHVLRTPQVPFSKR